MGINHRDWAKTWLILLLIEFVFFAGKVMWDIGDVIHKWATRF